MAPATSPGRGTGTQQTQPSWCTQPFIFGQARATEVTKRSKRSQGRGAGRASTCREKWRAVREGVAAAGAGVGG